MQYKVDFIVCKLVHESTLTSFCPRKPDEVPVLRGLPAYAGPMKHAIIKQNLDACLVRLAAVKRTKCNLWDKMPSAFHSRLNFYFCVCIMFYTLIYYGLDWIENFYYVTYAKNKTLSKLAWSLKQIILHTKQLKFIISTRVSLFCLTKLLSKVVCKYSIVGANPAFIWSISATEESRFVKQINKAEHAYKCVPL